MGASDFPAWYSAGIFGGIGCALLCALTIACWALWRRRTVTGGVIGALLVCLVASALDIGPLLWIEDRLNVYGPTLSVGEVGVALAAVALIGWAAPLAAMCWYLLTLSPLSVASAGVARSVRPGGVVPAPLSDPARALAVYRERKPWGLLTPEASVDGAAFTPDSSSARPIVLTQRLTLIGRELDNDIVLDDERISRRHAELRWERGRVELADYGSMNGTLVNQQAARGRVPLRDGDVIALGKWRYRLALQAGQPQGAAAASTADDGEPTAHMATRKTPSAASSVALGAPPLRLALAQGHATTGATVWPLDAPVTTIGRDPTCAIALADTSISRIHAQVTRQPAGYFITDLQSSNGVFVNSERLAGPTQIVAGDLVALGDCLLRCEPGAESSAENSARNGRSSRPTASPPPGAMSPSGAPSFHMRIAPKWSGRRDSRPRLAPPPRLAPAPRRDDTASS